MGFHPVIIIICCSVIFASAQKDSGDGLETLCTVKKLGTCPSSFANPSSTSCTDKSQCKGTRLCCKIGERSLCTDPAGSKSTAMCRSANVTNVTNDTSNRCLSDNNCDAGYTCCYDKDGCISYCVADSDSSSTDNADKKELDGKKDQANCPPAPINSIASCTANENCPRNQVCCLFGKSTSRSCSDPIEIVKGKCPDPFNMPRGNSCAADADCGSQGRKCCPLDDAIYRCVYPEDTTITTTLPPTSASSSTVTSSNPSISSTNGVTTTQTGDTSTLSSTGPITTPTSALPTSPTYPPGYPTDPPVCPILYKMCPFPFPTCDLQCSTDEICCVNARQEKQCMTPKGTKPGRCPRSDRVILTPNKCFFDTNCSGRQKCCGSKDCARYGCVNPV